LSNSRLGPAESAHRAPAGHILVINGGSSSIRFVLYDDGEPTLPLFEGKVDRIGLSGSTLTFKATGESAIESIPVKHEPPVQFLLNWLATEKLLSSVRAIGHRIVHGMTHFQPVRITAELIDELRRITPFDPEHLPLEIELVEACRQRFPLVPQVACFDTAFHQTLPRVASLLSIPRRYDDQGVRRYGFHGLSYEFLMRELGIIGDPAASKGRAILAHLGNGASLAAVRDGLSIDTSMGFTPTSGLMMSCRSGDLDPGLVSYLARSENMSAAQFEAMVTKASGLLGVSETSPDLRDLLAREIIDVRAREAVALFCYQVKKWIGSFAAALGGLDTLVFAGGIGENSAVARERICADLGFLGIEISQERNTANAALISTDEGRVAVRVIRANEELMIAHAVIHILGRVERNN
jgi:acetate kinase